MTDKKEKELTKLTEEYTIRKSNALVQKSRYDLTLPEQRLVSYVCAMIRPDEEGDNGEPYQLDYTIDFRDYCQACRLNMDGTRIYEELKATFEKLHSRCIWIPTYDETMGECEQLVSWFSRIKINKRSAKVHIDELLAPFLFHVKKSFSQYQLIDTLGMRSAYAMHIYEILNSYAYMGKATLSVDKLKRSLMVDTVPSYQRFPAFRQWVIDPAVAEINNRTPLEVSYKTVKEGRKVAQLVFTINQKNTYDRLVAYNATVDEIGEIGQPVKRGRGRPRKKPAAVSTSEN